MTDRQRQDIYEDLLQISNHGKLKRTHTTHVATKHNVHLRTVQRIWQRAQNCKAQGIPVDVKSRIPKNCHRKKIQVDLSRVADIPLNRRGTIRSLAHALGVHKTTLHRWFTEGLLRRHSSALRPYLKEANKKDRLSWCLSMLDPSTLPNNPKLLDMENIIHTDEKWFMGQRRTEPFTCIPMKKTHIGQCATRMQFTKSCFSAIGRPKFDDEGRCYFDGKLGTWPFVRMVQIFLTYDLQSLFYYLS